MQLLSPLTPPLPTFLLMLPPSSETTPLLLTHPSSILHSHAHHHPHPHHKSYLSVYSRSLCFFLTLTLLFITAYYLIHRYLFPLPPNPLKSPSDPHTYAYVTLPNALPTLLISSPTTPFSAAALSVSTGYYNDPTSIPGLAHFTEHMLFKGSDRYPDDSAFFSYIEEHGGAANAYTKEEETNFYFRITPPALQGALAIFSRFFIAPSFSPQRIEREIHAIESEHRLRLMDDDRRRYEILSLSSSPASPLHHYGTGSFDTLNRTDIRAHLLAFQKSHYSANRMRLVVLGVESLDELERMVREAFTDVPNRQLEPPVYQSLPFPTDESLRKIVYIEPVMDSHILTLYWQSPSQRSNYLVSPSAYLSFLLSHKSEGTLQHQLKSKGWLKFITASDEVDASAFNLYHVRVGLTDQGLAHVDEIITALFEYFHLILQTGITPTISSQIIDIERLTWLYGTPGELSHWVSSLASRLQVKEVEDVLGAPDRRHFDEAVVRQFIGGLQAKSVLILFSSSNFTSHDFVRSERERYYDIPYLTYDVPEHAIERWQRTFERGYEVEGAITTTSPPHTYCSLLLPRPEAVFSQPAADHWPFSLPSANPFISHSFTLLPAPSSPGPFDDEPLHLLRDDNITRVWWRPDYHFQLPLSYFFLEIRSPLLLSTPSNQAAAQLYAALVTESFTSEGYHATLAGYLWSVNAVPSAIRVQVSGYAEQLPAVLTRLFAHLVNPTMDEGRFFTVKDLLLSHRDNIFLAMQPYDHALYLAQLITEQHKYADAVITDHAEGLTVGAIRQFIPTLYSDCYFEFYGYGDVDSTSALHQADYLIRMVHSTGAHALGKHHASYHVYDVPAGRYLYQWVDPHNVNPNSAVYVSIFTSSYHAMKNSAAMSLLHLLIQPFCFERLRSQQQLGYVVRCLNTIHYNTVQSFDVLVQGAEYDAAVIDEKIEEMLIAFEDVLVHLPPSTFHTARQTAYTLHMALPPSMPVAAQTDWSHIVGLDHHFNRSRMEAVDVLNLTQSDIIAFYRRHILPNEDRRRVSVEVWGGRGEGVRLPGGVASPTAVITEENREGVKEGWRVWERAEGGKRKGGGDRGGMRGSTRWTAFSSGRRRTRTRRGSQHMRIGSHNTAAAAVRSLGPCPSRVPSTAALPPHPPPRPHPPPPPQGGRGGRSYMWRAAWRREAVMEGREVGLMNSVAVQGRGDCWWRGRPKVRSGGGREGAGAAFDGRGAVG